jgi:hypothetical protein
MAYSSLLVDRHTVQPSFLMHAGRKSQPNSLLQHELIYTSGHEHGYGLSLWRGCCRVRRQLSMRLYSMLITGSYLICYGLNVYAFAPRVLSIVQVVYRCQPVRVWPVVELG